MSHAAAASLCVLKQHVQVFKAKVHDDVVALKLLQHSDDASAAADQAYARRELATLKRLRHPHVVQVCSCRAAKRTCRAGAESSCELAVPWGLHLQGQPGSDHGAL